MIFQIFEMFFPCCTTWVTQQHLTFNCSNSVQVQRTQKICMAQQTFWIISRISSLLSRIQDWKMWRNISCRMGLIHIAQLCKANKQTAPYWAYLTAALKKGSAIYFLDVTCVWTVLDTNITNSSSIFTCSDLDSSVKRVSSAARRTDDIVCLKKGQTRGTRTVRECCILEWDGI